ncbi:DUF4268 domain-containing protein [Sinomicrobium soli]|uniref:DUF4268 domain-containing protein n=1 Tax=Sinomicrobium sp. N-1-3-6 TaxID=2219864 RepID=UPI000DCB36F1|nr:DUF4268 domain-containing protein [Sinomicrobium sp. N-1-3-6]RAV29616.1 DUF4268 domain-containing protein [Sinomicrobium sp. N-1-3-6]
MFSKEASKKMRQEFWTSFGKSYPRKWVRYHTGIKDLSLKFYFDTKKAMVSLDIEPADKEERLLYFQKISALKAIFTEEYVPHAVFLEDSLLDNGKEISRVYVEKTKVSIHNKDSWRETMEFLNSCMLRFEAFFQEYKDYIKGV